MTHRGWYAVNKTQTKHESNVNICMRKAWTIIDRLSIIWKSDVSDKIKWELFESVAMSALLYSCITWILMKHLEKSQIGTIQECCVLFWPNSGSSISQNCSCMAMGLLSYKQSNWDKDDMVSTYINQLCMDTRCSLEDLSRETADTYGWWYRERERERES